MWDHPRVCGEHNVLEERFFALLGSSPRVRGTLYFVIGCGEQLGIIPACAGNTHDLGANRRCRGDHPRVCGEHVDGAASFISILGSSPRVRGTPEICLITFTPAGIIPACAGNTEASTPSTQAGRDHPRVCGEHHRSYDQGHAKRGSSPRVRGTHVSTVSNVRVTGIIPACAGNTRFHSLQRQGYGDHPRVCGEHVGAGHDHYRRTGSSPRVRGTHCGCHFGFLPVGIIPACAGNTS